MRAACLEEKLVDLMEKMMDWLSGVSLVEKKVVLMVLMLDCCSAACLV